MSEGITSALEEGTKVTVQYRRWRMSPLAKGPKRFSVQQVRDEWQLRLWFRAADAEVLILLLHPACSPGWRRAGAGRCKWLMRSANAETG